MFLLNEHDSVKLSQKLRKKYYPDSENRRNFWIFFFMCMQIENDWKHFRSRFSENDENVKTKTDFLFQKSVII